PAIPIASSRTGAFVGDEDMARIDYWRAHFREPVRFSDAVRTLLQDPVRVFLEVGPGTTAATLVRKHVARPGERAVIASGRSAKDPRGELEVFLEALGGMWLAGVEPRWGELHPEARRRVRLPLYALERRRYGINGGVDLFSLGAGGGRAAAGTREGELPSREPPAGANAPGRTATAPRDDLERRVGAIWQRLLGVAQLDVHADFFAEGGDSFQAMQLIAEVSRELGTSLGPEALAGASTVAGMAQRLRALADEGARPSAHLVALAGAGPAAPVFLVHPVGGTVFIYRELAAALAPRPVYGLQASGLVGGPLPGSVSEMAAAYLSELAAVAPRGPLVLIGASAGGAIAYEMARQAGAAGRTVALVGLLDTPGPADVADVFADDAERIYYAVGDRLGMPLDELRGRSLDEQLARALVALAPGAPVDLERGRRLLAVFQAIERAFLDYAAPPLDLPVVYVRARARRPRWDPERPEAYWIERARAGLEIHVVEGDHISILHGPHVAALAGRLTGAIDRALRTP
ncbi:MAG TPA: thioesterase domain-containing protein, partial [Kofleriaceae bacterium]|nr:thioesterase domain-containing protein [Kofleriaceae bacterium]